MLPVARLKLPPADVERLYLDVLAANKWSTFASVVSAASAANSTISGPTGVKMSGPYRLRSAAHCQLSFFVQRVVCPQLGSAILLAPGWRAVPAGGRLGLPYGGWSW